MADEPKRKIEKQLDSWARQRREETGEPFELHPATREMLQGEVTRKHGRRGTEAAPGASWFAGLWPKFALGAALFAVLAVGAFILFSPTVQQFRSQQMAKETSAPVGLLDEAVRSRANVRENELRKLAVPEETAVADGFQLRDAPAQASAVVQPETEQEIAVAETDSIPLPTLDAAEPLALNGATDLAEAVSRPPAIDSSVTLRVEEPARRMQPTRAIPSTAQPPASMPTAAPSLQPQLATKSEIRETAPAFDDAQASRAGGVAGIDVATATFTRLPSEPDRRDRATRTLPRLNAQQFVRTEAVLKNESVSQTTVSLGALRNFELQQSATNLKVIDSDGSVYAGYLQVTGEASESATPSAAVLERRAADETAAATRPVAPVPAVSHSRTQAYYFNVAGTNRSLRQQIVFTGRLLAPEADEDGVLSFGGTAVTEGVRAVAVPQNIPLHRSRITGRASLGEVGELEVEAVARPD